MEIRLAVSGLENTDFRPPHYTFILCSLCREMTKGVSSSATITHYCHGNWQPVAS